MLSGVSCFISGILFNSDVGRWGGKFWGSWQRCGSSGVARGSAAWGGSRNCRPQMQYCTVVPRIWLKGEGT